MIRFRNPGTDYDTQVAMFKTLYSKLSKLESFNLSDIANIAAHSNLMTAYGYGGDEAMMLSDNEDVSRNTTWMNAKMYAEVYRQLGWIASYNSEQSYPVVFTFIGKCVAEADDPLPLYKECVIGINNPQQIMKTHYDEQVRMFKTTLFALNDLDGVMYKHELCLGPMSHNDMPHSEYEKMIDSIKNMRGSYAQLENRFNLLCTSLGMTPTSVDNCTRLPIAYLNSCGWVENNIRRSDLYPPKQLNCFKISQSGIEKINELRTLKDLRLSEFLTYDTKIQYALVRLGVYQMLERANYDVLQFYEQIKKDKETCRDILKGRNLLFSPYQTIERHIVDEALALNNQCENYSLKENKRLDNKNAQKHESSERFISLIQDLVLDTNIGYLNTDDEEIKSFVNVIESYNKIGLSKAQIVSEIYNNARCMTKTKFYPFIAMLFRIMGFNCRALRFGDNGSRFDAVIIDDYKSIAVEIKSPREELFLSLKSVRQALENKIVLLSRKTYVTDSKTTSLVVGYNIPAERADMQDLIKGIKKSLNFNIGVLDLKQLLTIVVNILVDGKTFDKSLIERLEGFVNVDSKQ